MDVVDNAAGGGAPEVPRHLLLVGMMGAGKTTVGELLARRLGWRYLDSDAQVVAATGKTVPQIFETEGEPAFRRQESLALQRALASDDPSVVSVAGGAVLDPANRALLRGGGVVVWLRARPETLAARVGSGAGRPLLAHDPAGTIVRLDAVRRPLYTELAHVVVDVDERSPDGVADAVLRAVPGLSGLPGR